MVYVYTENAEIAVQFNNYFINSIRDIYNSIENVPEVRVMRPLFSNRPVFNFKHLINDL